MKKKSWRVRAGLLLALVLVMQSAPLVAQTYDPYEDLPEATKLEKQLSKLGRGFSNILFGWTEIPLTFDERLKQGKPLQYLVTVAPVLGTAKAVMRTGVGVYETISFPYSDEELNYAPILEPEYLF
jgi:putative exosortase-associated protein (TIGR04073 family)